MHIQHSEYYGLLELLGALRQRRAVHNALNKIATHSADDRLWSLVGDLLHSFSYTSSNPLRTPLDEMTACKEQARVLRLYCQKMQEQGSRVEQLRLHEPLKGR